MKVFVDIDGVLANFHRAALAKHGITDYFYPVDAGWNIVKACNIIAPGCEMTDEKFWAPFNQKFWATLPKTEGCDELLMAVEGYVGSANVCLVTSELSPAAAAGKVEWIANNLPRHYRFQSFIGHAKHFMARPGALLIDDRDKNVADFNTHGGMGVLVPRPWNVMWNVRCSKSYVLKYLDEIFA